LALPCFVALPIGYFALRGVALPGLPLIGSPPQRTAFPEDDAILRFLMEQANDPASVELLRVEPFHGTIPPSDNVFLVTFRWRNKFGAMERKEVLVWVEGDRVTMHVFDHEMP
jgi:hypothetical protein